MTQTEAGVVGGIAATSPARHAELGRARARVGFLVFAATVVACVLATALDLVAAAPPRHVVYVGVVVAIASMGLLLTTRLPRHRISWVLSLAGLWWGVGVLSSAYAAEALVGDPGSLPWGIVAASFDNWAWVPGIAFLLCALLVLMPDGHLLSRRWWPVPVAVIVGTALVSVAVGTDTPFDVAGRPIENPLA